MFVPGQKFPTKSLEVLLKATLKFGKYEMERNEPGDASFCVGQTSYINVSLASMRSREMNQEMPASASAIRHISM